MKHVLLNKRTLFLSVSFLLLTNSVKAQIPNDSIIADFKCFVNYLETIHADPYTNYGGRVQFFLKKKEVIEGLKKDSVTSAAELANRISVFLIPLHDGHTK